MTLDEYGINKAYVRMDPALKKSIVDRVELNMYPNIIGGPVPDVHRDGCQCKVCFLHRLNKLVCDTEISLGIREKPKDKEDVNFID